MSFKKKTWLSVVTTIIVTLALFCRVSFIDAQAVNHIPDRNITDKQNVNASKKQKIIIDIPKLKADEYIVFELCDLQATDTIIYDITSNGKSTMAVGFMKDKDHFGITYFGDGDFYGEKGKIDSTFKVDKRFEGKYYLFVKNNGNETIKDIKGTVIIKGKKIQKDTNKKQKIAIDIPKLKADEYVVLELCDIQGSDTIIYDISSDSKGTLNVGFIKDKDHFGTTYFSNVDEEGRIKSTFKVNGFEGKYYLYLKNDGNNVIKNIKGTAIIKRK